MIILILHDIWVIAVELEKAFPERKPDWAVISDRRGNIRLRWVPSCPVIGCEWNAGAHKGVMMSGDKCGRERRCFSQCLSKSPVRGESWSSQQSVSPSKVTPQLPRIPWTLASPHRQTLLELSSGPLLEGYLGSSTVTPDGTISPPLVR